MSNVETYLAYLNGSYTGELPTPRAIRRELYLAKMCGMDVGTLPEPISQSDIYLKNLAENGTGGGADLPALVNAALAADILSGKEAIDGDGNKMTGTMPDNGTVTAKLTVDAPEYTIPAGKHSGAGKVSVETEEKSVTPTTEAQEVIPSEGKVLSKVTVEAAGVSLQITDARYLFYMGARLNQVDDLVATLTNITNMEYMFSNCTSITSLPVSNIDTSKVTSLKSVFSECTGVLALDVSGWDTSNVTNMYGLFYRCWRLATVGDLSNWDTSKVTDMSKIFYECKALGGVDVSGFDTSNVKTMQYMFGYCESLPSVDVSNFDTSNVTDMNYMFYGCKLLKVINMSNFDMTNASKGVNGVRQIFYDCNKLEEIIGFSSPRYDGSGNSPFPKGTASSPHPLKRLTFRTYEDEKPSIKSVINISFCSFTREGLVEMFNSLPDLTGVNAPNAKITITGNPCVTDGTLTDEDRLLATQKNWTLVE